MGKSVYDWSQNSKSEKIKRNPAGKKNKDSERNADRGLISI